jgi:transcription elongation GreA/GreB family factor
LRVYDLYALRRNLRMLVLSMRKAMELTDLKKRLDALPAAAQREVVDLIAALEARHRAARSSSPAALRDEPFIGCWAGRHDLTDSTAWVRRTRQQEWGPTDG